MKEFQFCDEPGNAKSRIMPSAAVRGTAVQVKSDDATSWELANEDDKRPVYFLERDVTAATLNKAVTETVLANPLGRTTDDVGAQASARVSKEIEVEGEDNLVLTGAGDLTGASVGDEIGCLNGKLQAYQGGGTRVGVVEEVLAAKITGNTVRLKIAVDVVDVPGA